MTRSGPEHDSSSPLSTVASHTEATPFSALSPDAVLDALQACGFWGDGRLLQLNSYENRVFLAHDTEGGAVVAKFYRPGRWSEAQLLEEHAFAHELAQEDIPVAPPLALKADHCPRGLTVEVVGAGNSLAWVQWPTGARYGVALFPRLAGRSPDLEQPEVLRWIGRFLGRIHQVGRRQAFRARPHLEVASYGLAARDALLDSPWLPPQVETQWADVSGALLQQAQAAFDAVGPQGLRLHGDAHAGNVLWREAAPAGPCFVDLDDALQGPAVQDLWMLLPGDESGRRWAWNELLSGYEDFSDFNEAERALIEPLRALRLIRHQTWIATRWSDPAFPAAYPGFGEGAYWQQQLQVLREQLALMESR